MAVVYKGETKKGVGKVEIQNRTNDMRRGMYIISNPGSAMVKVTVLIEGVQISPKELELGVGEMVRDEDFYMEVDEKMEILSSDKVHYYVVLL